MKRGRIAAALERVNREWWVILSLFAIALLLNGSVVSPGMVLGFYAFPTIASAYLYGRRHGTLTALAGAVLVVGVLIVRASEETSSSLSAVEWLEVVVWAGSLVLTGYLMGTLYEHKGRQIRELRDTYQGVLMILRHFTAKDSYSENHCYRVAVYATKIAAQLNLPPERIEDVRAAALLHDIGKLEISRDVLCKAAYLTADEHDLVQSERAGIDMLEPVGGALRRVIPIVLAHHEQMGGRGYNVEEAPTLPLEARIIAVADLFDALTTDKPYRKAMTPREAGDIIANNAQMEFDPCVVAAFSSLFQRGELEMWSAPLSAA